MSETIYELWHVYELYEEGSYLDVETFLGIFSSEEHCKEAIEILLSRGLFKTRSDKFEYNQSVPDQLQWTSGFSDMNEEEGEQ